MQGKLGARGNMMAFAIGLYAVLGISGAAIQLAIVPPCRRIYTELWVTR